MMLSAVICTYNRASLLSLSIESLCKQNLPPDSYEIIIVNNASTDETETVVKEAQRTYQDHNIRLINELTPGLSYARNTGWREASSDIVIYLDDDATVPVDWLENYLKAFQQTRPSPLSVAGPVMPFYADEKPAWFKDEYETYALLGETPHWITNHEYFIGANMGWAKSALIEFDGFDVDKGMRQNLLALGEETWLYRRIREQRNSPTLFYYVPEIFVNHLIPEHKLSVKYQLTRAFIAGQLDGQEDIKKKNMKWHQRLRNIYHMLPRIVVKIAQTFRKRKQYPTWQNWLIEMYHGIFIQIGYVLSLLGIHINIRLR